MAQRAIVASTKNRPQRVSDGKPGREDFSREVARTHRLVSVEARDRLISVLMHDLRSPLNGIQGWAHVLESRVGSDAPLIRKALDGVQAAIDQQVRLMAAAKDALHILAGEIRLEPTQVSLAAVVRTTLANVAEAAAARDLEFEQSPADAQIWIDEGRFAQALELILSHVVRSAGQLERVCVDIRENADGVGLSVGMPADVRVQQQSAPATTSALALAGRLLALNDAVLRIVPLERGSLREAFEIVLPVRAPGPDAEAAAARRRQAVAARAEFETCLQPLRIALVRGSDSARLLASLHELGIDPTVYAAMTDVPQTGVDVLLRPTEDAGPESCVIPCLFYGDAVSAQGLAAAAALAVLPLDTSPAELAAALAAAARRGAASD